ncbi:glycerate dehydrogenase [Lindgomyces ingoldianus]|uniref:Glycerate dehydrogenase n=1 Tax=Lindgomyces ingoldianus TaxID=673940 RepID=A0ACB6QKE2_9PLEO|nr:glycerate dehydrogenase [Lindgomyces ingoldianus]KAF2466611.1 glycerate dehydrogenase [Lindgomyces ingoldianus]
MPGFKATAKQHTIIVLESATIGLPSELDLPGSEYKIIEYPHTSGDQVAERIKAATILVIAATRLDFHLLSHRVSPNLEMISLVASGTDTVDLEACRKRGIRVCNASGASAAAVSEHALGFYFAVRRHFVKTHSIVQAGGWKGRSTLNHMMMGTMEKMPLNCEEETMGLIGNGTIGKRIAKLARMLGMKVLISDRKGEGTCRPGRTLFEDVLKNSTVLILVIPRTPESTNMISTGELKMMRKEAVLVNVSRGEIVDEVALVQALKHGWIGGAAVDVFAHEPATSETCPLIGDHAKDLNLITTPHTAWAGDQTSANLQRMAKENIEAWYCGEPRRIVA